MTPQRSLRKADRGNRIGDTLSGNRIETYCFIIGFIFSSSILTALLLFGNVSNERQFYVALMAAVGMIGAGFLTFFQGFPQPGRLGKEGIVHATYLIDRMLRKRQSIMKFEDISKAYWWLGGESEKGEGGIMVTFRTSHLGFRTLFLLEGHDIRSVDEAVDLLRSKGVETVRIEGFPNLRTLSRIRKGADS